MKHKNNLYRLSPVTLTLLLMVFALKLGFGQILDETFNYADDTSLFGAWPQYETTQATDINKMSEANGDLYLRQLHGNFGGHTGYVQRALTLSSGNTYNIEVKFIRAASKNGNLSVTLDTSNATPTGKTTIYSEQSTTEEITATITYAATADGTHYLGLFNAQKDTKSGASKATLVRSIKVTEVVTLASSFVSSNCTSAHPDTATSFNIVFDFSNAYKNGYTYTTTVVDDATSNPVSITQTGDDPNNVVSGTITLSGIGEDLTVTATLTATHATETTETTQISAITQACDYISATVSNGNWGETSTWSEGRLPNAEDYVKINKNTNILDGTNALAKVIELIGGNLRPNSGSTLTADQIITNEKDVVCEAQTASKSALLLVDAIDTDNSGTLYSNFSYKPNIKHVTADQSTKQVSLVTPPVSGETLGDVLTNNVYTPEGEAQRSKLLRDTDINSGATGNKVLFSTYVPSGDSYSNYTYDQSSSTALESGKGYRLARFGSSGPIEFIGTFNKDDITLSSLTNNAFNLIGNPFTTGFSLNGFVTDNSSNLDDLSVAVTYWDNTNGFTTKSQAELATDVVLAPAQAFFVKPTGSIVLGKANRTLDNGAPLGRNNNTTLSGLNLQLATGAVTKTTKLYFNAAATLGVDRGHEAQAFVKAIADFGIYTQLADGSRTVPLAVQTIPATGLENTTLKLGVNAGLGEHALSLEGINLPENLNVYLTDLTNGSETLLNKHDYTFNVTDAPLEDADRFLISFQSDALSTGDNALDQLQIAAYQNTITVNGNLKNKTALKVYDLQGRKVAQTALSNNNRQLSLTNSAGVYVVNLTNAQGSKTQKVILK